MNLVETLRLSQHAGLSIVSCDGQDLLVLFSERQGSVVRELESGGRPADISS